MSLCGVARVAGLLDDPASLTANPAAAHVEHLHRGFQVIVGECDDISIGAVSEHDRLLFQYSFDRTDVITQPRRPLKVEFCSGGIHLALQITGKAVGPTRHEIAEVTHDPAMFLRADSADTGRRAFIDIAEQTGTLDLRVPLEHSAGTGTRRKDPREQIERLPNRPGVRVRSEVAHTFATWAAINHQPRELLVECHRKHRIGLVVAVADVEPRIELLDPVVLELQCLNLGADHRPLHLCGGGHHLAGAGMQAGDIGEVRRQPAAQALGLPDVDHPAAGIPETVDAGFDRDGPRRRAVRRGIGHGVQASTGARPPGVLHYR